MEPYDLDLRLAVFEGASPSIGALALYARLRAWPRGLSARPAEYLVLCRGNPESPPSPICQSEMTDQDAVRLMELLRATGLPGRRPRVVPNASLLGPGPYVALETWIQGRAVALELRLEQAGFSGDDAEPLRAVLRHLAELTPFDRRPPVVAVVERPGPRAEAPRLRGTHRRWQRLAGGDPADVVRRRPPRRAGLR